MISIAFCAPLRLISSRLMVCTGSAPSPSMRLMLDPVISTLMSTASAGPAQSVSQPAITPARRRRRDSMCLFFMR